MVPAERRALARLPLQLVAAFALLFVGAAAESCTQTPDARTVLGTLEEIDRAAAAGCKIGEALLSKDDPSFGTVCATSTEIAGAALEVAQLGFNDGGGPPDAAAMQHAICACVVARRTDAGR